MKVTSGKLVNHQANFYGVEEAPRDWKAFSKERKRALLLASLYMIDYLHRDAGKALSGRFPERPLSAPLINCQQAAWGSSFL